MQVYARHPICTSSSACNIPVYIANFGIIRWKLQHLALLASASNFKLLPYVIHSIFDSLNIRNSAAITCTFCLIEVLIDRTWLDGGLQPVSITWYIKSYGGQGAFPSVGGVEPANVGVPCRCSKHYTTGDLVTASLLVYVCIMVVAYDGLSLCIVWKLRWSFFSFYRFLLVCFIKHSLCMVLAHLIVDYIDTRRYGLKIQAQGEDDEYITWWENQLRGMLWRHNIKIL